MKRRNPHLVFLSNQIMDILIALKTFSGGSGYVLPSRYDSDATMSQATLNHVLSLTYMLAQKDGKDLQNLARNKAEYREQHTAMLQDWADMIDGWTRK